MSSPFRGRGAAWPTRSSTSTRLRDQGPNAAIGPAFKYEDVTILDLKLTGKKIPATVGAGDKFRFIAEVGEFNADRCLFFLDPVPTEVR
ncbi:DUF4839 domain-containing protein [Streptomyces sp. NBC_01275]|uniref:DUF4839 domain-containing protein n=1 Tax=Streptomyces sp. NBC_01275 TaxID=2903807 RepID=UPI002257F77F|nr:DUF4839 domain-containing protein [Streptomyces sp. NBC_01275]MCX4764627.1 DUF4839 domain-containing protein [Streptomyces sp. NBC_01275]